MGCFGIRASVEQGVIFFLLKRGDFSMLQHLEIYIELRLQAKIDRARRDIEPLKQISELKTLKVWNKVGTKSEH